MVIYYNITSSKQERKGFVLALAKVFERVKK
jgi:hypothetical protein